MTCPGGTSSPGGFELPPGLMRELLAEAADLMVDRMASPTRRTVATLARERIERILPSAPPRDGGGARRLREILVGEFLPFTRDYRHPLHLGHQRPAPSFASLYADLAAAAFNPSVTMFEGGPYAVAVEQRVLAWMKALAGFPPAAIATLVNGGAEAHLTALLVARDRMLARGHALESLRVIVGEHAHYTLRRAAHVLGLAPDALIAVPSNPDLSMDVAALADAIAAQKRDGGVAMAIVAAAGATANGAFDDLDAAASLAAACGAWFHVDAAHGGAACLSDRHRPKLKGAERADSLVINPHKLFFVSSPCAILLCRHRADFAASLDVGLETARYVIPDGASLKHLDDGDEPLRWTLACTRFFSAFRLYAALCTYGTAGLGARVDRACDLASFLADAIDAAADFDLLARPAFNMVCFRHHPAQIAPSALDQFNQALRQRIASGHDAYLTGCEAHGTYWLRAQFMSQNVSEASLGKLLPLLRREARNLIETGKEHDHAAR